MPASELVHDEGVLEEGPVCEFQGMQAVRHVGGVAVLPWRADWLEARARDLRSFSADEELLDARFSQCLVHLQKSRAATWLDLAHAWARLEPGGRLLFCGGNDLGVTSAVKRLARELGQTPRILANRRRARIVAFLRDQGPGPSFPDSGEVQIEGPAQDILTLRTDPGVFSARRLDQGSELLLAGLPQCGPPERILDLGCGVGPLGLSALLRWPDARADLLDADARAVTCAIDNAESLALGQRCQVTWWDASEPLPADGFDLVLLNPPFHGGKAVDLGPAYSMFEAAAQALTKDGLALIIANRTLPYERTLRSLGHIETLQNTRSYKLLTLRRSSTRASQR